MRYALVLGIVVAGLSVAAQEKAAPVVGITIDFFAPAATNMGDLPRYRSGNCLNFNIAPPRMMPKR